MWKNSRRGQLSTAHGPPQPGHQTPPLKPTQQRQRVLMALKSRQASIHEQPHPPRVANIFTHHETRKTEDAARVRLPRPLIPMGVFAKFKAGLQRTHNKLTHEIKRIVTRSPRLDAASLEELEAALIAADLGLEITGQIVEAVRKAYETQGGEHLD